MRKLDCIHLYAIIYMKTQRNIRITYVCKEKFFLNRIFLSKLRPFHSKIKTLQLCNKVSRFFLTLDTKNTHKLYMK